MKQMEDLKAKLGPESLLVPESSTFAGSIKTAASGSFETKAAQKKIIHEWEKATKKFLKTVLGTWGCEEDAVKREREGGREGRGIGRE